MISKVYFLRCDSSGLIKIGVSTNVAHRVSAIQSGSPTQMTLLATEEGGQEREKQLHDTYAEHRVRGEWYRPTDELLDYISDQEQPSGPKERKTLDSKLLDRFAADCVSAKTTPRKVLRAAGIHESLWWKWATGRVSPTLKSYETAVETLDQMKSREA